MLTELKQTSKGVGLNINFQKNQIYDQLSNNMEIDGNEQVYEYKYLEHEIRIGRDY